MPKKDQGKQKDRIASKPNDQLPAMSAMVAVSAKQLRNIVNLEELSEWLKNIAIDKLEATEPERKASCEKWLFSVAKNWMIKNGETVAFNPSKKDLASQPAWVQKAIDSGATLQRLSLIDAERERLASVLDWLRSSDGPSIGSDWSRISLPQAEASEKAWIDAKAKAALKRDLEAADAAGTELFAECSKPGPGGRMGWRWVKVSSKDALDREGALMRHCVGSYAEEVEEGRISIYSLRDPDNQPKLTVEAREGSLWQLKAFANQACPSELKGQVSDFARAFEHLCEDRGWIMKTEAEMNKAGVIMLPGAGLVIKGEEFEEEVKAKLDTLIEKGEKAKLNDLLPLLVSLGDEVRVGLAMKKANQAARNEALYDAAKSGYIEMVRLLLTVTDPMANDSLALRMAAKNGHTKIVKLLLPVSDSRAQESDALLWAAVCGHTEIVKLLLPGSDPLANSSEALISAAKNGSTEIVKLLLTVSDPKARDSEALRRAARNGHSEIVKLLLPVSHPKARDSEALRWAAEHGHTEIVALLLPVSDPLAYDSEALRFAARLGHTEVVKLLHEASDVLVRNTKGLRLAAESGHIEIVKLLLPKSDPLASDSEALRGAARAGHAEIVKILLPVSNPLARDSEALRGAIKNGHIEVASLIQASIDQLKMPDPSVLAHKLATRSLKPKSSPSSRATKATTSSC